MTIYNDTKVDNFIMLNNLYFADIFNYSYTDFNGRR